MSDLATSKPACDVCKDTSCARGNLLLHCTGSDCTVVVHKNCYGVKQTSTTSWKCAPCAAGLKTEELRCVLCSRTGGPYKQVGEANEKGGYKLTDSWAHVLCALWVPETYFGNADTMEPVLGVQTIDPDRFLMCCVACHKVKQGACVQCRFGNCTVGLHPTCVSLRKSTSVGVALPSGNAPDEYALVMYCNVHAYRGRQAGYVLDPTVVQQPIAPLFVRKTAPVFAPLKDKLPSGFKLSQPNKPVTAFAGPKKPGRRAKVENVRVEDTESDASSVAGGDDNGRAMVADQDAPIKMWSLIQPFFTRPSPASWQALMFQTPPPIGEVPPELQYIVNRQSMPVTTAASPASSTPALPTVSTSTSPMNSAGTPRPPQVQFPSLSTAAASISGVREDKFEIQRELLRSKIRLQQVMMRANVIKAIVGNNALRLLKPETEKVKEKLTEATWLNHEVWKSVTTSLVRGVRDQSSDFNKWKEEVLPASWAIPVDGRAHDDEPAVAPEESDEDAVCQVCFDGESFEANPIVFCDKCNIAIHKRCYGISVIPEGDFFCDRCKYLRFSSSSAEVVCCLCPIADGAFKQTIDRRWVHLVCALWHPRSIITDVSMMGPVDISGVLGGTKRLRYFAGPSTITELNNFLSGNLPSDADAGMLTMPETTTAFCSYPHTKCVECKSDYGATLACASPGCSTRLHPLCAWYAGFYVSCSIDPSCALLYNENPAERGLSISLYCQSHVPPEVLAQGRSTVGQRQLRCKYRGGEMDASNAHRRRSKRSGVLLQSSLKLRLRALPSDVYTDGVCGVCFDPSSTETVTCNVCSIATHRACYGLNASVVEGSFTCQRCLYLEGFTAARASNADVQDVTCCLCPRPGGLFKQTVKGSWVHMFCALMMPRVTFALPDKLEGIELKAVPAQRYNLHCYLCNKKKAGACMQCEDCFKAFHPMCAQKANCFMNWHEVKGAVVGYGYCQSHNPPGFKFDAAKAQWVPSVSLAGKLPPEFKRMVALRKELDNARLLCERTLRREKFKRNILTAEMDLFDMERQLLHDPVLRMERIAAAEATAERNRVRVVLKVDQVPGSASLRCLGAAEPLVPTVTPASTVAPTAVAFFPPPPDDITKPSLKKAKHTSSTVPMVPIVAAIPTVAAMPGVVVLPAPTFNKDTRQGTRAVTAPAKLELEVDASKVSLSKVHKAKVGSVSTGESSVTGPKAASVKSFGTKPTSLKVKVPTEVAPDVPKFKAAVAEAASQVTSVSKVARIKTASPKAVTAGASQKTSMVVGPKNPGVPAAVAKSRALIAAPSAPGLVATGPKASTSPRAAVLEAPVVAMKPAASIMASAVLKPALLMQPEPNSIALKAQKIKAAAKLVPQLTESSVTAPKPVSPRASSIVAVSALHAATAAKSTVSKAKPSKPARAHADVATEVEVKLVQKAVVSKAAAVSKEAAPKQPTPKPPVLKVPKVELVPEAPAELKGMKKNLKRPLDAVEVAALPAPLPVSVQGLDSLEGSLIPWPAVLNDGAVHDFDMLSCALKPVDAAQLQLLIRDRTRYCSLDMAAWRMLPQAAKSRARKVTSRFSDWFAEERLEEQPDFLANYRPLSTPERVCLDFQLYSIMERIVGGAAQAEDGLPCPPELTTIISPPSLDEIGVDDGRITLPMSVSLIRERIQRQQYHSVDDMLLDFEMIIANLKGAKPAAGSIEHRELQLLKKRVDHEKASTHILVKRRRGLGPESAGEEAPSSSRTVWKCASCSCPIYGPGCNKKPSYRVFCKDCLSDPSVMLGQRLFVYWTHDDEWYPGVVEAYHPLSKNFRVLYDDHEWEFMSFGSWAVFDDKKPSAKPDNCA